MKRFTVLAALLCLFFAFQAVFASTPPQAYTGMKYNGTYQYLVSPGVPDVNNTFYYRNLYTGEWDRTVPSGRAAGVYEVEYVESTDTENLPGKEFIGTLIRGITISESTFEFSNGPHARRDLVYNAGSKQYLVDPTSLNAPEGSTYYFRNRYTGEWTTDLPEATDPGVYSVEYILSETVPNKNDEGFFIYQIPISNVDGTQPVVTPDTPVTPVQPVNPVRPPEQGSIIWHWIEYQEIEGKTLPGTGFPTRFSKRLSVQPDTLRYIDLNMRIQIPVINVDVELTGVPETRDSWAVDWLDDRAGLLVGTDKPGEGFSIVAAHNHLNETEIGPFAFLFSLENNDRIFVNTPDGGLKMFSVYANELLDPDDLSGVAAIAEKAENSLVLVTCENEMMNGEYMNRRIVFAKPLY